MPYSYANYTGNGVASQYLIPCPYLAQSHIHVFVAGVELTLGVDFTIDTGTNKVVLSVAPANAALVNVRRITPRATSERTVDFASGAGLKEEDLDNSALQSLYIQQELLDDNESTLRGRVEDGSVTTLPDKAARANKALAFDGSGQPVVVTKESLVLGGTDAASAAASAAQGYRDEAQTFRNSAETHKNTAGSSASAATASAVAAAASAASASSVLSASVAKAGSTMTGALVLSGNATAALQAVPKQQAESIANSFAQGRAGDAGAFTFRNRIINGNGSVNQRGYVSGTATSGANQYTLDRWRVVTSGQNLTFSTSGITTTMTAPAGGVEQVIEGAWNNGAAHVISWTGTATCTVNGVAILSGYYFTVAAGSNITVRFSSGTFTNVQVESGTIPTPFELRPPGVELALCQRYYQTGEFFWSGNTTNTATYTAQAELKVTMRTTPTVTAAHVTASNFPSSPGVLSLSSNHVRESRISNGTGTSFFATSYAASAEL